MGWFLRRKSNLCTRRLFAWVCARKTLRVSALLNTFASIRRRRLNSRDEKLQGKLVSFPYKLITSHLLLPLPTTDEALYALRKPNAGVRELASFVSRVPSNHGHVVWHPEKSSQDIPPWVRHSAQVSVTVLGNPVQLELS